MSLRRVGTLRTVLLMTACPFAIGIAAAQAAAQNVSAQLAAAPSHTASTVHHHRTAYRRAAKKPFAVAAADTAASQAIMPTAIGAPSRSADLSKGGGAALPASGEPGESVIVTGTRALNRKARDSTSPIDVISAQTLARTGQPNLADQLQRTDPSINPQASGNDTEALVSSIQLRGLSPNETLVLVDGKRRHPTSNIFADAGPAQGATPVDINMIPAAAIDHIEVLRDGAAAQYGSDAIAGVVNIILKKTDHGTHASAFTGANAYNGDGWRYQLDADQGASFGSDGYVHIGAQAYHTDHFVQKTTDDRLFAYPGVPLDSNKINSTPEETRETLSIEAGSTLLPNLFGGVESYGLITYGHRHAEAYENYRTPDRIPTVYPAGFSPLETDEENDYSAELGLKANDVFGFHVDLSTVYGADITNIGDKNSGNRKLASTATAGYPYYPPYFTPTTVLAQSQNTAQWTNNLDFVRPMSVLGMKSNLAFGGEERSEVYRLGAGAPASYLSGGTQGFAGLLPANAGDFSRNVWAAYLDYDFHPVPKLDIDLAGRFEHYTDFGNTENGKLSSRYDFTKWFAIRGTISNGFRAPTLAEENFSALNVSPNGASGDLAVNSAAARALGAVPLKPERSTNATAGFVLDPVRNLDVTVDVYQINIRDRIVGSQGATGDEALDAIRLTGATISSEVDPRNVSAFYFANGASTRTQGLDINVNYFTDFRDRGLGTVTWTAGLDLNRTRLHHNGTDAFGQPFLTAQTAGYITTASPRSKLILNAFWRYGKYDLNLRQTRYGESKNDVTYQDQAPEALQYSGSQFYEFKTTPVWLTDVELAYHLNDHWRAAIGANNVFNEQPRRMPLDTSYLNVQYYDNTATTIPITGGFYYGRINYSF